MHLVAFSQLRNAENLKRPVGKQCSSTSKSLLQLKLQRMFLKRSLTLFLSTQFSRDAAFPTTYRCTQRSLSLRGQNCICARQRLRLTMVFAIHLDHCLPTQCPAKTLMRLRGCACWIVDWLQSPMTNCLFLIICLIIH